MIAAERLHPKVANRRRQPVAEIREVELHSLKQTFKVDGFKPDGVAIMPVHDNPTDSFKGQEYLGLYPIVQ
jgi:hypothetical protein